MLQFLIIDGKLGHLTINYFIYVLDDIRIDSHNTYRAEFKNFKENFEKNTIKEKSKINNKIMFLEDLREVYNKVEDRFSSIVNKFLQEQEK